MNLSPSESQLLLKDALARALARESTPARVRQAEAAGHDPQLWSVFQALGLPLLRAAEAHGGAAGSLLDAVVVSETLAERLATIPGVEAMVVAGLLSRLGGDAALAALEPLAAGGAPVALALHEASERPDQLVPAAAAARSVIFRRGDELRLAPLVAGPPVPNTGGLALGRLDLAGEGVVLQAGPAAIAAFDAAVEEWKLLTAAAIAAAAKASIDAAAAYAREREAFGRPIGSFQGLAHPLAEANVQVEGAALLVRRAVEAIAAGRADAAALASLGFWWAAQTGLEATVRAMRVFGGYGMTAEYDAQLYYRRATAWALLPGDPAEELKRAGDRLWAGAKAALPPAGGVELTFEYAAEAEAAAQAARRIFTEHATPERRAWLFASEDGYDPELYRKLAAERLLFPDWPRAWGGGGCDAFATAAVHKVYADFGWSYVIVSIMDMLGKMIMHFGSEQAKREILPQLARGEIAVALCYTEPSCGSDVFAARTRARRDGDDWVIDGQKIFTSQGHIATYGLMLARTSDADKHGGVTMFALPLDQPGYRCDPIETVGGERTNTTFYAEVRVPDAYRLGEVDGGAKVLAAALSMEQGSADYYVGALREILDAALGWAERAPPGGAAPIADREVRARLAAVAAQIEVADVLNRRTVWAGGTGQGRKHYGPSAKLFGSEAWIRCSTDLMKLAAPAALAQADDPLGHLEKLYRRAVPSTIYAGTSEVQRSLIAEAGLGMPRSRS